MNIQWRWQKFLRIEKTVLSLKEEIIKESDKYLSLMPFDSWNCARKNTCFTKNFGCFNNCPQYSVPLRTMHHGGVFLYTFLKASAQKNPIARNDTILQFNAWIRFMTIKIPPLQFLGHTRKAVTQRPHIRNKFLHFSKCQKIHFLHHISKCSNVVAPCWGFSRRHLHSSK